MPTAVYMQNFFCLVLGAVTVSGDVDANNPPNY